MRKFYYSKGIASATLSKRKTSNTETQPLLNAHNFDDARIANLPAFLRTLLVADGTITRSLEAYFWEPIKVITLDQSECIAENAIPWLNVTQGHTVLVREASLEGVDTSKTYAKAFSVIRAEHIPEHLRNKLIEGKIGIGVLISDSGMESYREMLELSFESPEAESLKDLVVSRTYRIFLNSQPAILITEQFQTRSFI